MEDDPVLVEAARWVKKLNNPNGATYRLIHARKADMATVFKRVKKLTADAGRRNGN